MRATILAVLAALLFPVTGWTYSANDGAKTITSDGSFLDTQAAINYVNTKAQDGWVLTIGTEGGVYDEADDWIIGYELDCNVPYNFTIQGASPTVRTSITHSCSMKWTYAPGKLLTIKDIRFVKGSDRQTYNQVLGSGPTPGFRFTNCRWEGNWVAAGQLMLIGTPGGNPGTTEEGPYGLFDNCEWSGTPSIYIYCNNGSGLADSTIAPAWRRPMEWGTQKAVYFEDCSIINPSGGVSGFGITDSFNGGSFVFRHNYVENIMVANHGADHFGNYLKSALKHEIYNNEFHFTTGSASWIVYLRGGTAAIYDNTFQATGGATATQGIYWDYYRGNSYAGPSNTIYDRFYNALNTTIAAGSNGQDLATGSHTVHVADTIQLNDNPTILEGPAYTRIAVGSNGATLPQSTINVASTADFPSSGVIRVGEPSYPSSPDWEYAQFTYTGKTSTSFTGCTMTENYRSAGTLSTGETVAGAESSSSTKWFIHIENIKITTSAGIQTVRATGKTATTFTGVYGGTGTMSTGAAVTRASDYLGTMQPGTGTITALIAAGSNGASLPQGTIHVDSTVNFPASGTLKVNYDWTTGTGQTVTYTGKTATTFTGCAGGAGTMTTGNVVGGIGQDPRYPTEIIGSVPIWQWNNVAVASPDIGTPLSGRSVADFIGTDRDIYVRDSSPTRPTSTGTWLDEYTPLVYPHPINTTTVLASSQKRARVGGKTIRIGGKVLKIGDN